MTENLETSLHEDVLIETEEKPKHKWNVCTILKFVLRILLGAFFIATAVMKLLSLENFELYIYSFNIFSFAFSAVVARAVIALELLFGALLIAKILYKQTWWLTMAMLCGFSLLLVYVAIFRHDSNCHCMGDIVELNPVLSIVKNLIMMALLLIIRKESDYVFKGKVSVGIAILLASIAAPYALFPTDSVYELFAKDRKILNEQNFDTFMQDSLTQTLNVDEGNFIFGYVAAGCQFCKLGTHKLKSIVDKHGLDNQKVVYFIWGKEDMIADFKKETEATAFRYVEINPIQSIQITNGAFPTFVFVQNGKIMKVADLKGLDEKYIVSFIGK